MADDKKIAVLKPGQIQFHRAPDYKVVYVNNIRVGMSAWDVQLAIGQTDAVPPSQQAVVSVQDLMTLVFTPAQAKSLTKLLTQAIANYEEAFGKVEFPDHFLDPQKIFDAVGGPPDSAKK